MPSPFHTYVWKGNNDLALTKWPVDAQIKQISLGLYHSAFLTHDGQVLCCGQNSHGQLGIGTDEGSYMEPIEVTCLRDEEVTSVAVGLYHTVCGTQSGSVYCWGDSTHSQCCTADPTHYTTPICIASFSSPIKKVDCCSTASVALLADGHLFAWGSGLILQDTAQLRQQVLEPSPFKFIEHRFVLDVSCGANYIVAVLKKTVVTEKKLVSKNNYVVVHKSESGLEAFSNGDDSKGLYSDRGHCPLGLEVAEEHVFASSSGPNSPASVKRVLTHHSRSTSLRSIPGGKFSRSSSADSLVLVGDHSQLPEPRDDEGDSANEDEIVETRSTRSMGTMSCHSVINVNQNEAEKWLMDRIGSQFSVRDGEVPADSGDDAGVEGKASPRTQERLPQYVESMWNSITSSSQAVSSAVQTHIVSKIPLLDKLSRANEAEPTDAMGLTSLMPPGADSESREGNSQTSYKAVAARAIARTGSSSAMSSPSQSRSVSRAGSRSNVSTEKREFHSAACIATEVWSWGTGDHGQLGHGDCLDRLQPCMITSLSDSQVYRVECSQHSALALSTNGKVYGWGDNSKSQIVHKDKTMLVHPDIIPISAKLPVVDISLGADHALLHVLSPANVIAKSGMFTTGATSHNELGTRLEFTRSLGCKLCMAAGPNNISSICVQTGSTNGYKELSQLYATEMQLYRMLLDILTGLVEPIVQSDYMAGLIDSPYGHCLKGMIESLFLLIDKIGLNCQELSVILDPIYLEKAAVVGNHNVFLKAFTSYATHFHNFLAMNGLTHLVDIVKPILLNNESVITSLLERCQLEFNDQLVAKVSILLQLPLRRVSEYHELVEQIQLNLEDGSMLVTCLTALEQAKTHLSTQYSLAESTRTFWEKCPKTVSSALKEPHRRLVRESKSLPLQLVGGSKLYKNWFVLFNDVFVHVQVQYSYVHKVYPLEKLWIEMGPSDSTAYEHEIRLIMPEASMSVQASNTAEKAEWMYILNQTVTHWLSSYKSDSGDPTPSHHRGVTPRITPANRVASHMFYKTGPLHGAVYKGKWQKGEIHGDGQMTWADGRVYTGQFAYGEQTGYGKLTCKVEGNTETMEGYWLKGKLHGFAKTRFANGNSYTGFYKDHLFHGHGVLKERSTPSIYVGEWKAGKRHGYGVLDSRGEKFLCQWIKDNRQGPGLHITLDGCYMEGAFTSNKLIGQGLIMTSDDTYYEGSFTGLTEVNGKGVMVMNNGDCITGTFDGNWADGIKVNGVYEKAVQDPDMMAPLRRLPKSFGKLSTSHDLKWMELFHHARVALGCQNNQILSDSDCEKAWEKVAVVFASLRSKGIPRRKKSYSEHLEKIPAHNLPSLSLQHYRIIRRYLSKACDCDLHPLGLLLKNLVDVYRTSYSGTGTHHRLLIHARDELLSITYRYYDVIRMLFPELPLEHYARKILSESALLDLQRSDSPSDNPHAAGEADDIPLVDQSPAKPFLEEESEVITPTLLLFPMLLPKIYEPLFHLYALQDEAADEQYWTRISRFNKQCDVTLFSYLGIPEKFWLLGGGSVVDSSLKSLEVRDECYVAAIETLQRMSTCLTPAEKLHTLQLTFDEINILVKESLADDFVWSMDDLFPVFLFVVIRARLRYLGSEIRFMDELMDDHLEFGELGLMFTTLKACHLQIQTEKLL